MRIVLLTSKLNFKTAGGSVMDLHLKAKGLADAGHEVTVVTAFSKANIISDPLPYHLIEENASSRGLLDIQYHAWRILRKYAPQADVIYVDGHIFIYGAGLYRMLGGSVPVAAFFNVRLNCWGDTSGNQTPRSAYRLLKKGLRIAVEWLIGRPLANAVDAFIFNTPQVEKLYLDWGFKREQSTVIEDFVDMQTIIHTNRITAENIAVHQQSPKVITLFTTGRMLREKGFDIVLNAFALLEGKDRYRLIVCGGGPDKDRIVELAQTLDIDAWVSFPGWVTKDELADFFKKAHIFIFPKWWIEYGSALLTEALAFGMPCIIPGGGALEWLTEGRQSVFHHDSPRELADRISELGVSDALRIRNATSAFERAQTLDCQILTVKLLRVINSITQPASFV